MSAAQNDWCLSAGFSAYEWMEVEWLAMSAKCAFVRELCAEKRFCHRIPAIRLRIHFIYYIQLYVYIDRSCDTCEDKSQPPILDNWARVIWWLWQIRWKFHHCLLKGARFSIAIFQLCLHSKRKRSIFYLAMFSKPNIAVAFAFNL